MRDAAWLLWQDIRPIAFLLFFVLLFFGIVALIVALHRISEGIARALVALSARGRAIDRSRRWRSLRGELPGRDELGYDVRYPCGRPGCLHPTPQGASLCRAMREGPDDGPAVDVSATARIRRSRCTG